MTAVQDALLAALSSNPKLAAMLAASLTQPKPGSKFAKKAKGKTAKAKPVENTDRKAAFAASVVASFAKAGIVATPNVDVFTYSRWIERGFRPVGPSVRVKIPGRNGKGMPMWHRTMVEALTASTAEPSPTVDPVVAAAAQAAQEAAVAEMLG